MSEPESNDSVPTNEPTFLTGGFRPPSARRKPEPPASLPDPRSVVGGSTVLDEDGNRWRSAITEWLPVDVVTASTHRAIGRRKTTFLVLFLVLLPLSWVFMFLGADFLALFVVCVAVAIFSFVRWIYLERKLHGQDVAPDISDE